MTRTLGVPSLRTAKSSMRKMALSTALLSTARWTGSSRARARRTPTNSAPAAERQGSPTDASRRSPWGG
eukprot:13811838-Alexandrium_andersonii.AAC.1